MKKTLLIAVFAISAVLYAFIFLCFSMPVISLVKEFIPERKKEIDFTLKYSLNGEVITISDTAVCEFDRHKFTFYSAPGIEKVYKIYIPGKEKPDMDNEALFITLLDLRKENTYEKFGKEILELYFYGGNGNFYMNESGQHPVPPQSISDDWVEFAYKKDGKIVYGSFTADEAEELFGVRMISFDYEIRKK